MLFHTSSCDVWRRLDYVGRVARKRGLDGCSARWFMNFDCANAALRHRHSLMFLSDVAVILQNGSPYMATGVSFGDTLQKVHEKRGASLLVLSSLLRDVHLFQALPS